MHADEVLVRILADALTAAVVLRDTEGGDHDFNRLTVQIVDALSSALERLLQPDLDVIGVNFRDHDYREIILMIQDG